MKNNIRYNGDVNVSSVISQRWYFVWENLRGFCCIFISFLIFNCRCSSFTFGFRHHPSPFRGLSPGFYTHFILSAQPIAEWFATPSFPTILISSYRERYGFEWAFFTHTLFYQHFWLIPRLSRPPWEPAVLPWSLQGFILILETQTQPICLFDSQ